MIERYDPIPFSSEVLVDHLRSAALGLGADFFEPAVRQSLEVFGDEFQDCVVQLKAGSKPGSGLYYRFFYNGPRDLTAQAQRARMIPRLRTPLVTLQEEVLARFPGGTRAGLDFDAGLGLAKVWTFTGGPVPLEQVLEIPAIPASVRAHAGFFEDHGLHEVFFVASDFQKGTMNVYFGWDPACRTRKWIQEMVAATGGEMVNNDLCREILQSQANSGGVGFTFSWDQPELLRWCLYSLEVPFGDGSGTLARLPYLPARLKRFRSAAPTLNVHPQYNVAWSFGRAGNYVKLEKSYARDASHFLTCAMGGDLRHPEPLATAVA